jgi:hypothetical protein
MPLNWVLYVDGEIVSYSIFVSYSTKDIEIVDNLKGVLNNPGIDVFVAEYSVKPSESLNAKIYPAIQRSDLFILLWSKNSEVSPWVEKEIEHARAFDKIIFPVLLDEEAEIPAVLQDIKYLPAHASPKKAMDYIKSEVFSSAQKKSNNELVWMVIGAGQLWLAAK